MKHNKEKHEEMLRACWNFKPWTCMFEDNCWFKHGKKGKHIFETFKEKIVIDDSQDENEKL